MEYRVTWEGHVIPDATVGGEPVLIDRISALIPENQWMGRLITDLEGPLVLANRSDGTPVVWSQPVYVSEPPFALAFTLIAGFMILIGHFRYRRARRDHD